MKYDSIKSFTFADLDIDKNFNNSHRTNGDLGHMGGKDAGIALLIILPIKIATIIAISAVDKIMAQVHTYQMTDWKVKVKLKRKTKKKI